MDFTYKKYIELLSILREKEYTFYTLRDWIIEKPTTGILLRHDVDRYPRNSFETAVTENKLGIKSTYYFRIFKCSFNIRIIKEIYNLGHEIGYHYEDLSTNKGNYAKAINSFAINLKKLREYSDINTISMHGRPLSKFDNRDLWEKYDFNDYGLIGEAYKSIDYSDMYYFTDTGRTWSIKGVNYRDSVESLNCENIVNTDDLIRFISQNRRLKLSILTHPERWNDNFYKYSKYFMRDKIVNFAKKILIFARKSR